MGKDYSLAEAAAKLGLTRRGLLFRIKRGTASAYEAFSGYRMTPAQVKHAKLNPPRAGRPRTKETGR